MGRVIQFEERAVAKLRDQLGAVEEANQDLVAFAHSHSSAVASIHAAALAAVDAGSLDELIETVVCDWPSLLGVDDVALALVVNGKAFVTSKGGVREVDARLVEKLVGQVRDVSMLGVARGHALFGSSACHVRAEALVPIANYHPIPHGLLLLGQRRADHVDGRHGASLLGFLGEMLAAMMRRWLTDL